MGEIENFSKLLYRQVVSLVPHSVFDVECSVFGVQLFFYFRENGILRNLIFFFFLTEVQEQGIEIKCHVAIVS